MSLLPVNTSNISSSISDSYNDIHLITSYGLIIVEEGQGYNDQEKRELPALLFEFYVEDNGKRLYLQNMNRIWTVNNNQPVMLINMPTDAKMRIVPLFDLSYINTLDNPSSDFDLRIYVDPNITLGGTDVETLYPVGSTYSSPDQDFNPNETMSFGTWVLLDQVSSWSEVYNNTWGDMNQSTWKQVSSRVITMYVWQRVA